MSFLSLNIKNEYRTTSSNIIRDFYLPVLEKTIIYQRAVGFFSSSALSQLFDGIEKIAKNNGKIQLIVSPKLSDEDIQAISKGYKDRNKTVEMSLMKSFEPFITQKDKYSVALLSKLIELNILDIKIAFLEKNNKVGMFHEKLGIMYDKNGNYVSFSGSLNESLTAYSYNVECIDVYKSWLAEDLDRAKSKKSAFEKMWANLEDGIDIIEFPKIIVSDLRKVKDNYIAQYGDFEINEVNAKYEDDTTIDYSSTPNYPIKPKKLDIRDYQDSAVDNWKYNFYAGIFDMATGTGKTITAIYGLTKLFREKKRLAVIIVAPYTHLVEQWVKDLNWFNIDPIIGYSDTKYSDYRKRLRNDLEDYNLGLIDFLCFITTNASFRVKAVQDIIIGFPSESLIIVDEAHNFGSERLFVSLPDQINYRLALSATLERHNDPFGTQALYNYFGSKCIEYSLEKAISEKKLSPYNYYPIQVTLTNDEYQEYSRLTAEIAKHLKEVKGKIVIDDIGKKILLKRSRLVAGAKNKVDALMHILKKYSTDNGILIYCGATNMLNDEVDEDEIRQIDLISKKVYQNLNMVTSQFTSNEDRETREKIVDLFIQNKIQGIVAIKCLDEGVNIPSIKTAFILASSTNPKEHVQRRGRVLRLSDNKEHADIYDFIVFPRNVNSAINLTEEEKSYDYGLVKRELKRVQEFGRLSMNSSNSFKLIHESLNVYPLIKWSDINKNVQEEDIV